MRALILTITLLTLSGPSCLLAQDQGKPALGGSRPVDVATPPAKEKDHGPQVIERLGPGMDWDHRKPGRDLKLSPRPENDDARRERD